MKFFELARHFFIVKNCQKFLFFLPLSYLIDIRTAKFLEPFVTNANCLCRLFVQCTLGKLYLVYGDDIISSCNLRSFVTEMLLNNIITNDIIMLIFT